MNKNYLYPVQAKPLEKNRGQRKTKGELLLYLK